MEDITNMDSVELHSAMLGAVSVAHKAVGFMVNRNYPKSGKYLKMLNLVKEAFDLYDENDFAEGV